MNRASFYTAVSTSEFISLLLKLVRHYVCFSSVREYSNENTAHSIEKNSNSVFCYSKNEMSITSYLQIDKTVCYDIFVNCNWVVTRWQFYSTHLHTNNKQKDTKQTIHRTTQQFERVWAVPRLG